MDRTKYPNNRTKGYMQTASVLAEILLDRAVMESNIERLKRRIDEALDNRDEALFLALSAELKQIEEEGTHCYVNKSSESSNQSSKNG